MAGNNWKLLEFAENGWKLQKWLEMSENGWKWLKTDYNYDDDSVESRGMALSQF